MHLALLILNGQCCESLIFLFKMTNSTYRSSSRLRSIFVRDIDKDERMQSDFSEMDFEIPTRRKPATRTIMWAVVTTIVLTVNFFNAKAVVALSMASQKVVRSIPFRDFKFAPNNVCISPQYFVATRREDGKETDDQSSNFTVIDNDSSQFYFTMRNVPGDGDCMFLAVALAAATSMGLGGSNQLLQAISQQTRDIVAQVLSAPTGKLFIGPGKDNVVEASRLLKSAVLQEPTTNTTEEYLEALRKEGRNGGLYGGGPELVALSNILRRPISIYEVDEQRVREELQKQLNGDYNKTLIDSDDGASPEILFPIVCKGSFGEGIFEDPHLTSIPDSVILSNMQPGAYSWRLHILVLNSSPTEKHACVLLPQRIYK